jgi:hypothetical protein
MMADKSGARASERPPLIIRLLIRTAIFIAVFFAIGFVTAVARHFLVGHYGVISLREKLVHDMGNEVWGQSWMCRCSKCSAETLKASGSSSWRVVKKKDGEAKAKALGAWNARAALKEGGE